MDNASVNGKMAEFLSDELMLLGIPFDKKSQILPCYDHVLNLAVQDFLKVLEPKRAPRIDKSSITDQIHFNLD